MSLQLNVNIRVSILRLLQQIRQSMYFYYLLHQEVRLQYSMAKLKNDIDFLFHTQSNRYILACNVLINK